MAKYRIGRINDEMARQLAVIFRNIRDPRLDSCLVSVTAVDTKPDLRFAKIYYSVINYDKTLTDEEKDKQVQEALESSSGFVRSELARLINLRLTPELTFVRDASMTRGAEISAVLKRIEREEANRAEPAEEDADE
ncbi:MAG TPA: 30S ribosome-binding factor RbfA [Clostridiales bacterium]|jgi:ribosome-binding factor A|nr:30S ribosome-binding factor RbfA [Clostridiales bacterium]